MSWPKQEYVRQCSWDDEPMGIVQHWCGASITQMGADVVGRLPDPARSKLSIFEMIDDRWAGSKVFIYLPEWFLWWLERVVQRGSNQCKSTLPGNDVPLNFFATHPPWHAALKM